MTGPKFADEVVRRDLQFVFLVDYSGSMAGAKISTLNQAIREVIPEVQNVVQSHPECRMLMRAIKFSDNADWHIGPDPVPVENFVWQDLHDSGLTATASAIQLLCDQLEDDRMSPRNFRPVCVLISDGFCTETQEQYQAAIGRLNSLFWGDKAIRLAIAVGQENEYDEAELQQFVNQPEIGVLKAHNPTELIQFIRWSTVATTKVETGPGVGSGGLDPSTMEMPSASDEDDVEMF